VSFPNDAFTFNAGYTLKGYFFTPHKSRIKKGPDSHMGCFKKIPEKPRRCREF
jgi:hypothetical protein